MKFTRNHIFRFLAILFISASLSGCGSKPEKAADHFMALLVAGKHLEAQDMLSKDMKSMVVMAGGLTDASLKRKYRSGNFKSYTLTVIEKTDKSVRYQVVAHTNNGTSGDFMDLTLEDGEWKVAMF
jgi:hypothetical protein